MRRWTLVLVAALVSGVAGSSCNDDGLNKDVRYTEWSDDMPAAGYADGNCPIPDEAMEEDVSAPSTVIGDGTPESCTSAAVVEGIAKGGIITFDCGPDPVTILMEETAKIHNDTGPDIVIDGGGKVALSGNGQRRILYMNTCDSDLVWTTDHCNDQDHPRVSVQNLTFVDGDSRGEPEDTSGGGAIWARGGRLKVINCRFFNNMCELSGPDVGGAGIRVFDQYQDAPVYLVHSTFGGGEEYGNTCSNGGGISSIGVSWSVYNTYFSHNTAVGNGGNPAEDGTAGGGSGGAIYNDGNTMTLSLCGTGIEHNEVNAYGAAIFFVSNDHSGNINIEDSVIRDNINHGGSTWEILPGISGHTDTPVNVDGDSIIE